MVTTIPTKICMETQTNTTTVMDSSNKCTVSLNMASNSSSMPHHHQHHQPHRMNLCLMSQKCKTSWINMRYMIEWNLSEKFTLSSQLNLLWLPFLLWLFRPRMVSENSFQPVLAWWCTWHVQLAQWSYVAWLSVALGEQHQLIYSFYWHLQYVKLYV